MKKSTLYYFALVLVVFVAFITLGGLGNIAAQQHFYWLAFVANIGVYAFIFYELFKKAKEE